MQEILTQIHTRAKERNKTIVLPEAGDPRVLKAAEKLCADQICKVILLGEAAKISETASQNGITLAEEIEYQSAVEVQIPSHMVEHLHRRRKHKGMTNKQARNLLGEDPLYLAATMIAGGEADAGVAGSVATTGEVIRSAIHAIGLREGVQTVSSTFLMALKNGRVLTYADCGVVPYPDASQLADIAVESARTHQLLTQKDPKVAMLSFSTKGSARHERTELVTSALALAQQKNPALSIDGELQFDAAFVPAIAQRKAPKSTVAGQANVFIFPNLDAGNIAYKITERLAGATATGPILQGLAKPMMDLSRGCSWQDIVNAACVAILMTE